MLFIYIFTYFLETAYYRHSESSTPLVILRPWVVDWQRIESGPTVLKSGTQPTELFTNQSAVDFPVFCIRPRPHVSVSIREFFFFLMKILAFRIRVNGVFGHQKRRFFNMDPWVDIFENAGWSFSFGRTKTKTRSFSNTMMSFIIFVLMDKKTIWITYAWMCTVSKNAENIPAFNTKFMHFYF